MFWSTVGKSRTGVRVAHNAGAVGAQCSTHLFVPEQALDHRDAGLQLLKLGYSLILQTSHPCGGAGIRKQQQAAYIVRRKTSAPTPVGAAPNASAPLAASFLLISTI